MQKWDDISGQRFGLLTAVSKAPSGPRYRTMWHCRCDCGKEYVTGANNLKSGNTQSCGCAPKKPRKPELLLDLIGDVYGRLTVLWCVGPVPNGRIREWMCRCSCGKEIQVAQNNLRSGNTESCGCYKRELTVARNTRHGESVGGKWSPEFATYKSMISRCYHSGASGYHLYGGRGIGVCDQWRGDGGYAQFLSDMGRRPTPNHSLDKIDNDKNYSPSNCRWATTKQQGNNRRNNQVIYWKGERMTITQAAEKEGVKYELVRSRIVDRGWSAEEAMNLAVRTNRYG
jgi:hypothetical protein